MLSQPTKPGAKTKFDFTAALIRRRKAAVSLLLIFSIGAAVLALVSFVKLLPSSGDASHSGDVLTRIAALDRALYHGNQAVDNKDFTPREAQAMWTNVGRAANVVADTAADDQQEGEALSKFRDELKVGEQSLDDAISRISKADPLLAPSARQFARAGLDRIVSASTALQTTMTRQLDDQIAAARLWLGICIGMVFLTGLMMAVTVLTWIYANHADRARARRMEGYRPPASAEAVNAAERLSEAIENGPLAVVEWDTDFVCTRWSGRAEEMFGRPADTVLGKSWTRMIDHVHPEDEARVHAEMRPLLDGQTDRVVIRHRNLRADRTIVHCVWYNSVVRDHGGKARAYFSLADDITREVEVEEAFRSEAQLVRRIADASPFGISVSGADGSLQFANGYIMDLFGITKEEAAAGKGALKAWSLEELDGTPIPDSQRPSSIVLRTGQPVIGREVRVRSPFKPEPLYVSLTAVPLRGKNGAVDAVLIIHENIETRIAAEQERESLADELNRARRLETVGNLASGIAHDFGNALLAISYSADTLAAAGASGLPTAEPAAQLKDAIAVARDLTGSLVNYAAGRDGTKRPLDLAAFMARNCKFIGRLLPPHFKVVCVPPASGTPVMVSASGPQLLQVMMNLAVNARDAMPTGGTVTIAVGADTSTPNHWAVVEVSDTGQGMTPEVSRRVFERYYTTKNAGEGAGLGLPTVQHIVNDHGGTIELSTAPGQGSRFIIRLPLLKSAAPASPDPLGTNPTANTPRTSSTLTPASTAASTSTSSPTPSAATPRAMVVESDERVRPLIVQTLRNTGYHVESFTSAEAGLDAFTKHPTAWSVVLLELDGQGLDGVTCLRRMRKNAPEIPALMLTADPADASGHLVDGRTRVLLKPFTVGSLRSALNDLLGDPVSR